MCLCVVSARLCEPGVFSDAADCSLFQPSPLTLLTGAAFKAQHTVEAETQTQTQGIRNITMIMTKKNIVL